MKPCPICTEQPLSGNPDDYEICADCKNAVFQLMDDALPLSAEQHEQDLKDAARAEAEHYEHLLMNWRH